MERVCMCERGRERKNRKIRSAREGKREIEREN